MQRPDSLTVRDGGRGPAVVLTVLTAVLLGVFSLGLGVPRVAAAGGDVAIWKVYPPGWNLIAGPAGAHLAQHDETLLSLAGDAATYTSANQPTALAGEGYWVLYPRGAVLLLTGTPQAISAAHVDAGHWATIGNSGTKDAVVRGADIALTYDPLAGYTAATSVQPGQAALVYAYDDVDVFLDPYASAAGSRATLAPRSQPPGAVPALPAQPATASVAPATPDAELNYLYALGTPLADLSQRLGDFSDNLNSADPAQPSAAVWRTLGDDVKGVASDLAVIEALVPPERYVTVQGNLATAISDIADGMQHTVAGLLGHDSPRVSLGSGLLAAGARQLQTTLGQLPQ